MEFSWPGEKLLLKLCDTVASKGIGSLLKPWQMRREGAAAAEIKRLNTLTLAQTKIEVAEIQSGRKVLLPGGKLGDVNVVALNARTMTTRLEIIAELEEIVRENVQKEAFRKEVSVAKAVLYAEQELEQETQACSDVPVSDDWLLRWRDNASSVSSDELQALWGKVLAGEVKSPGSFSLRALEFLRNISHDEAVLIEKIAPYVISNFVLRNEAPNALYGTLTFSHLLELQELGILSGVEAVGMAIQLTSQRTEKFAHPLKSNGRVLVVSHSDANRVLELPAYCVTRLGLEVLKLGWKKPDEIYLQSTAKRIKEMGFEVEIGNYIDTGNSRFSCMELTRVD